MIVGFSGAKYAGKSASAKILREEYKAVELAFAAPLKEICTILFDLPIVYFTDPILKEKNVEGIGSPRQMMTTVGTFLGDLNENTDMPEYTKGRIWVFLMSKNIELIKSQKDTEKTMITISDVRYPAECKMIKKNNGIIIDIKGNHTPYEITLDPRLINHESETSMREKYIDYTIENNGTLNDLSRKIIDIIERHVQ